METKLISAIVDNLKSAEHLLEDLTKDQFNDTSIGPYHSSIGGHLRHILDVFSCAFKGIESRKINLINRDRNELVETIPSHAANYLQEIIDGLHNAKSLDGNMLLIVTDDLGAGPIDLSYTLSGLLAQAHSHAIHHFACIGYILEQLEVVLPDSRFGYNPTTPEKPMQLSSN